MPCDTRLKIKANGQRQTISERKAEIQRAIDQLSIRLLKRQVTPVIDKATGALTFAGWSETERDGITDACAYRRVMATGNALAKAEIARAEALAGRAVDKQALAVGVHSHDGGATWHNGH